VYEDQHTGISRADSFMLDATRNGHKKKRAVLNK